MTDPAERAPTPTRWPEFASIPESDRPLIRLNIARAKVHAPTAAEIYQFRDDTASPTERKMLLSLDPSWDQLGKGKRKDGFYPVSWISSYGKGRTFYCSLGHRNEIYHNPHVLEHYLAGFQYILGDLAADATPAKVK